MQFSEVIGQNELKERLLKMLESGKIPHAMMLCGQLGYGGLPVALATASWLLSPPTPYWGSNGHSSNAEAMLHKWQHPDLHFIFPVIRPKGTPSDRVITSEDFMRQWTDQLQASPYFTFEDWFLNIEGQNEQAQIFASEGDRIAHKLSLKSSQGGYKVCIMWLPERMNPTFANKILKLLEEPPQETVFILVSENPGQLLETIRSRVQRIDIPRLKAEDIEEALVKERMIDPESAHRIARIADGSWLKAVKTLDSGNENLQFHDLFMMLMRMAYQRNTKGMKKWSETVAGLGREKQKRMLAYFSQQIRENFMYNFHLPELCYLTEDEENFSKNFARFVNEANVIEMQELIDRTMRAIGQNANAKIEFFDLALNMIVLILRK